MARIASHAVSRALSATFSIPIKACNTILCAFHSHSFTQSCSRLLLHSFAHLLCSKCHFFRFQQPLFAEFLRSDCWVPRCDFEICEYFLCSLLIFSLILSCLPCARSLQLSLSKLNRFSIFRSQSFFSLSFFLSLLVATAAAAAAALT